MRFVFKMIVFPFWLLTAFLALMLKWTLNLSAFVLALSAMFAALCCVTTMLVQFPTVAGYTNIGEGMCLLAGLVLGPWATTRSSARYLWT